MAAKPTWPDQLREYRKTHGLSQMQAASALNIHVQTWALWEQGRTIPRSQPIINALMGAGIPVPEGENHDSV